MKKTKLFYVIVLLFVLSITACSKDEETKAPSKKTNENPFPATSNNDIISSKTWQGKEIERILTINNNIYTCTEETLTKRNSEGVEIWQSPLPFNINVYSISQINNNQIIIVGNTTTARKTSIFLYDLEGNLLDTHIEKEKNQTLNSCKITDNLFIASIHKSNTKQDYFLDVFSIESDNKIKKKYLIHINNSNDKFPIINFSTKIKKIEEGEFIMFSTIQKSIDENNDKMGVLITKLGFPETKSNNQNAAKFRALGNASPVDGSNILIISLDIKWQKTVYSDKDHVFEIKDAIISDKKIFLITNSLFPIKGGNNITPKETLCLNFNGNILWRKKINSVNIDKTSFFIHKAILYNSNLFIVGAEYPQNKNSGKKNYLSNALLIKMNTEGNIKYIKTFGDKTKKQEFNFIEIIQNTLKILGKKDNDTWFVEVNP